MMTETSPIDGSIQFGLLLHNHQPVGNFPWVFEKVYSESYFPMLQALERHPGMRVSLHYTGSLLDWLAQQHPEFLERVGALVTRGQVEIVSGGYYEPILPTIPDRDKVAQISRLTERLERLFGVRPTGMWLAERVWEPSLPRILKEAGIEWAIVDDIHFKNVGLEDKDLYGYYATEDQGDMVKVYATSKALRYTIPWRPVQDTIEALRALSSSDGQRIAVMGDDGEKFGSWPETQSYCWGKDGRSGWVDEFFQALEENRNWLHMVPLGSYIRSNPAVGRVYLPTTSYVEMTEWALPSQKAYQFQKLLHRLEDEKREDILQFMRGGFWRNFIVRYAEVNNLHKKMLRVHERVYAAGGQEAQGVVHLWKAQANDTYWHGLFGGIYMTHVRSAMYHHLIEAENLADRALHGEGAWQRATWCDFERDTHEKLLVESDQHNLYIDPQHGGTLFEWDLRRSAHNLLSVITRYEESYHQILRDHEQERRERAAQTPTDQRATQTGEEPESPHTTVRTKEAGLDRYLVVDPYRRASLIDHFLPPGLPLVNFAWGRYEEFGTFANAPYTAHVEQQPEGITITLTREGQVRRAGALGPLPVHLTKTILMPLNDERLSIRYTIENRSQARLQTTFAQEWNINMLGGGKNPQAYYRVEGQELKDKHFDSSGETTHVHTFHLGNTWLQQNMAFTVSEPATLWRFPIETVTGSEAGFERTHQGSCLLLLWTLQLDAGDTWQVDIDIQGTPTLPEKVAGIQEIVPDTLAELL